MADGTEAAPGDEPPAEELSKKYDQDFFLALAAKGKEAWNAWRRDPANKDVRVTFEGVDFSEASRDQIDFSGFEFGDYADFSNCKWRGVTSEEKRRRSADVFTRGRAFFLGAAFGDHADFTSAVVGEGASFNGATFGDRAAFIGATFGRSADFTNAVVGERASFNGATFGDRAAFIGATFGRSADFTDAEFGSLVDFTCAEFGNLAHFTGAAFGNSAYLTGAAFGKWADFTGAAFGRQANFKQTHFKGTVYFEGRSEKALKKQHEESWKRYGSGPDRFLTISFARARFDSQAIFSGRSFVPRGDFTAEQLGDFTAEQRANFTFARFCSPPNFDDVKNVGRINFTGAHIGFSPPLEFLHLKELIHWTEASPIPVRLRALRKIVEETKNHDLERDLYIEERKAERGVYWHQLSVERKRAKKEFQKRLEGINKQKTDAWSEWRLQAKARVANTLRIAGINARLFTHVLWILVMGVYWALADYGRSFLRPSFWWLALNFIVVPWLYRQILPVPQEASLLDADKYEQAVQMVALANSVPFIGPLAIDAKIRGFLFCLHDNYCPAIPPHSYQWLVLGQTVVSITFIFFIGLALRNYFKIK